MLKGRITDSKTSQGIPFAEVYCLETQNGTTADDNGFWKITDKLNNQFTIRISAVGYESQVLKIKDEVENMNVALKKAHINLDELIVSTSASKLQRYSTSPVDARKISDLNTIQTATLIDALSNMPGVYNLSTGNGISKPVIRGLSGMRVLTIQNGLRVENQQWGGDHGFALTDLGIEKVEVIKGPSSLIYGADALGGVIYSEDEAYANIGEQALSFSTRFETNSLASINKLSYKTSKNKLRLAFYGGYFNRADYQLPDNRFVSNSRNSGYSLKGAIGYNKDQWVTNFRYQFLRSLIGLPGHTHGLNFTIEDFVSTKQKRSYTVPAQNINNHLALWENKFFLGRSKLNAQLGYTSNQLQEYEEKVTVPAIDMTLSNYTYTVRWNYQIGERLELITGSQGMLQQNRTAPKAEEVLIPNTDFVDAGVYSLLIGTFNLWNIQGGFRYDQRTINTAETPTYNKQFDGINYSFGVSRSSELFTARLNASSGFRPPHISEILANGVHHGTTRYLIGDVNLNSERANQIDFYFGFHNEHLELIVNPFLNSITNFIYQNPTNQFINGYQVFNYEQTNAILSGGDIAFHYHPHLAHWLHFESNFSMLNTEDQFGNPLPQIPQNRLNNSFKFQLESTKKLQVQNVSLQYQYLFSQDQVSTYETRTPSYQLINLGLNGKYLEVIRFSIGVNNVLNEAFIDHLSRLKPYAINNPGRNFYIKLSYQLSKDRQ